MAYQTRYDMVTDVDSFYDWLETCPVHYRFIKHDNDYYELGFFSILEEE